VEQGPVERAAVVVVRAWTEFGPPRRLKIRMMTAADEDAPPRVIGVTTDIDQACSMLRAWLVSIASQKRVAQGVQCIGRDERGGPGRASERDEPQDRYDQ
jgi:hypothetical protein